MQGPDRCSHWPAPSGQLWGWLVCLFICFSLNCSFLTMRMYSYPPSSKTSDTGYTSWLSKLLAFPLLPVNMKMQLSSSVYVCVCVVHCTCLPNLKKSLPF